MFLGPQRLYKVRQHEDNRSTSKKGSKQARPHHNKTAGAAAHFRLPHVNSGFQDWAVLLIKIAQRPKIPTILFSPAAKGVLVLVQCNAP